MVVISEHSEKVDLDAEERERFEYLATKTRQNILLLSAGGTGKTYSVEKLLPTFGKMGRKTAITATTGVAAVNVGGQTFHKWSGIGLGLEDKIELVEKVEKNQRAKWNWRATDDLIIDEISLFGAELFDKIDFVARSIRGVNRPFGGMRVIAIGDFLQLPPVKDDWVFKADKWDKMNWESIQFLSPKRYPDEKYFQMLMRIRRGMLLDRDIDILEKRVEAYKDLIKNDQNDIKPTILFSLKQDSEAYNIKELAKLESEERVFTATDEWNGSKTPTKTRMEGMVKTMNETIPYDLSLKVGAQVMLKANLSNTLINGSRGIIKSFNPESITVQFKSGEIEDIKKKDWDYKDNDGVFTRSQYPLILAYAITIHKIQGCTLDYAVVDIGKSVFAAGQAYVALSRVRELKGLFLKNFDIDSVKADPEALEYVDTLFPPEWIVMIFSDATDKEALKEIIEEVPEYTHILTDAEWISDYIQRTQLQYIQKPESSFKEVGKVDEISKMFKLDVVYVITTDWKKSDYYKSLKCLKDKDTEMVLIEAEVKEKTEVDKDWFSNQIHTSDINDSWMKMLIDNKHFDKVSEEVTKKYATEEVYPPAEDMFNAFKYFDLKETTVVILGQDPYFSVGLDQAHGLSFSVRDGIAPPPSLKNIYKEIISDLGVEMNTKNGNLEYLAKQGVLLLNTALTVKAGAANSHAALWSKYTDELIEKIASSTKEVVWMLWGGNAKKKYQLIKKYEKSNGHLVLQSGHPSPLSVNHFLGNHHFSQANEFLGDDTITWSNC